MISVRDWLILRVPGPILYPFITMVSVSDRQRYIHITFSLVGNGNSENSIEDRPGWIATTKQKHFPDHLIIMSIYPPPPTLPSPPPLWVNLFISLIPLVANWSSASDFSFVCPNDACGRQWNVLLVTNRWWSVAFQNIVIIWIVDDLWNPIEVPSKLTYMYTHSRKVCSLLLCRHDRSHYGEGVKSALSVSMASVCVTQSKI